jgi:hypothetical protein
MLSISNCLFQPPMATIGLSEIYLMRMQEIGLVKDEIG